VNTPLHLLQVGAQTGSESRCSRDEFRVVNGSSSGTMVVHPLGTLVVHPLGTLVVHPLGPWWFILWGHGGSSSGAMVVHPLGPW